jgi:tetratricopeptide (TPR) repeat protein
MGVSMHIANTRLLTSVVIAAFVTFAFAAFAQGPSPSLKQADIDYRSGFEALSRNDLNTALQDFEKVVRLAPTAEQGYSALGAVLVRMGRTSEGIRELEKALTIKSNDSSAQLNLAVAYEQSEQPAKALLWFAKVETTSRVEKRSLPAYAIAAYARALAATQQFSPAVTRMKEAIAEDPRNAEWQDELGSIYAMQKDWPNAKSAFNTALKANPNLATAHFHLGAALEAQNAPGALDELTKAYQLAPQNSVIALELGQSLAAAGDDEQAVQVLRHAVELDPASTAAAYQLGLALQRTDKMNDAIPLFQRVAAAEPVNAEVLINLGLALCQMQMAKEAVPVLQHAVALAHENITAHQNLAAAYVQLSQFDDAVGELRTALKLSPSAPQLHYNLGLAFKMQDDAADAIPELESAEKLDPSMPEPPFVLGVLYMQAGRYADAARELNTSLKLQPDNGDGWATLGSVYSKLDKLPEAVAALQEAIRRLPEQPDPHLTLAAVLVKQNHISEATAERKIAAGLMHAHMNRQQAEVATNSANSLLKSGKVENSIIEFRNALSYDPDYAEAHVGLANALQQQGKVAEAAVERQKADMLKKQSQR